ncbi:MAG: acyl carrier protein [Bacteroidales bacterium]|jgi:acyl carrier protein|nr:acyl carrier protein [Bacteroidales bacterium]
MEEKILEIMKSVFGVDSIDSTCSQENCEQWDSMAQLNLTVELEMEFDITLEPEEIGEMTSFSDVVRIVKSKTAL